MKDDPKEPTNRDLMAAIATLRDEMESGFASVAKEFVRVQKRFQRIEATMATKADLARLERRVIRLDDRVSALER